MPRKKAETATQGQLGFDDFKLQEVNVRLRLEDSKAYYSTRAMYSPDEAVDVMRDIMKQLDREHVCVVNMDNQLRPINFNVVAIGTVCSCGLNMPEVFKPAILSNANHLMMMHNHPSGNTRPSQQDMDLTKKLVAAAKILDITVLDHLVVAARTGEVYSIRSHNPEIFDAPYEDCVKYLNSLKSINKDVKSCEKPATYSVIENLHQKQQERTATDVKRNVSVCRSDPR